MSSFVAFVDGEENVVVDREGDGDQRAWKIADLVRGTSNDRSGDRGSSDARSFDQHAWNGRPPINATVHASQPMA